MQGVPKADATPLAALAAHLRLAPARQCMVVEIVATEAALAHQLWAGHPGWHRSLPQQVLLVGERAIRLAPARCASERLASHAAPDVMASRSKMSAKAEATRLNDSGTSLETDFGLRKVFRERLCLW